MINFNLDFWLLVITTLLIIFLFIYLLKKKDKSKGQLRIIFIFNLICILIISVGVLIQTICSTCFDTDPILFENFIYIGTCFLPVSIFFTGSIFTNTKIQFKKSHLLLFIIPIISLIVLWTNKYHNLFYISYSSSFTETSYGSYFYIHTIYSYVLLFIGIIRLLYYTIKNSGFFSKQSLLVLIGVISPTIINVLGSFLKLIPMTVFATPIAFSVSIICFTFAIYKFDFLKVAPIALQRIVDRISDSYIVINEDNKIIDFNKTFLDTFKVSASDIRNKNLFEINDMNSNSFKTILEEIGNSGNTILFKNILKV